MYHTFYYFSTFFLLKMIFNWVPKVYISSKHCIRNWNVAKHSTSFKKLILCFEETNWLKIYNRCFFLQNADFFIGWDPCIHHVFYKHEFRFLCLSYVWKMTMHLRRFCWIFWISLNLHYLKSVFWWFSQYLEFKKFKNRTYDVRSK